MQKEKIAIIALVIIIVASLSTYIIIQNPDMFENLFKQKSKGLEISYGDCVNISYIGRYSSNGTVFESSYTDIKNKTKGDPLLIYVTLNKTASPPVEYNEYSQNYIDGLIEGIVGLKEGETVNLTIPPEKAYGIGKKIDIGDSFSTKNLTATISNNSLNQILEVINLTNENITLKWLNVQNLGNFTLPEGILTEDFEQVYYTGILYDYLPPYYIWENSSTIINITNSSILIKTTPTKTNNLTKEISLFGTADEAGFIFPDATTAEWNETKINIRSSPLPGAKYKLSYMGITLNITVVNITETHINTTLEIQGEIQPYELIRTMEFNRTFSMRRIFVVPLTIAEYIFNQDVLNAGLSLNKLSGEELIFEVTVEKIYDLN